MERKGEFRLSELYKLGPIYFSELRLWQGQLGQGLGWVRSASIHVVNTWHNTRPQPSQLNTTSVRHHTSQSINLLLDEYTPLTPTAPQLPSPTDPNTPLVVLSPPTLLPNPNHFPIPQTTSHLAQTKPRLPHPPALPILVHPAPTFAPRVALPRPVRDGLVGRPL